MPDVTAFFEDHSWRCEAKDAKGNVVFRSASHPTEEEARREVREQLGPESAEVEVSER